MSAENDARQFLATTAALLDQGRLIDGLSRILTAAAAIGLMLCPLLAARPSLLAIVVLTMAALLGLAQTYLAIRVGFDAALFRRLANEASSPGFRDLDAALEQLGLMPAAKSGRDATERAAGAKRLFDCQCLALIAQIAVVVLGAMVAATWP